MEFLLVMYGFLLPVLFLLLKCIYSKLRRRFPIKVNCWFCNRCSTVHYDDRNAFVCPGCLQYNGFEEDGGYNKSIPEQYDEMLNTPLISTTNSITKAKNGLCKFCNNNQQLKIFQLSNFVPLNEENYDMEIEHFQKQLERAYQLCPKCDAVLKKRIVKQSKWLLGMKVSDLQRKGLAYLKEKSFTAKSTFTKSVFRRLADMTLFVLMIALSSIPVLVAIIGTLYYYGYQTNMRQTVHNYLMQYYWLKESDVALKRYLLLDITSFGFIIIFAIVCVITLLYFENEVIKETDKEPNISLNKTIGNTNHQSFYDSLNSTSLSSSSSDDTDFEQFATTLKKKQKKRKKKASPTTKQPTSAAANRSTFTGGDIDKGISQLKLNPKPIPSPSRPNRNPWTGGSWDKTAELFSRSSSQSSGFASAAHEPYTFASHHFGGDFERNSVLSEPTFKPIFRAAPIFSPRASSPFYSAAADASQFNIFANYNGNGAFAGSAARFAFDGSPAFDSKHY